MDDRASVQKNVSFPVALDIVKIDGRWAQVFSGGPETLARFLDDGTPVTWIDWGAYRMVRFFNTCVGNLELKFGLSLSRDECARLHYGPEQREDPGVVDEITVFAEYERRK